MTDSDDSPKVWVVYYTGDYGEGVHGFIGVYTSEALAEDIRETADKRLWGRNVDVEEFSLDDLTGNGWLRHDHG